MVQSAVFCPQLSVVIHGGIYGASLHFVKARRRVGRALFVAVVYVILCAPAVGFNVADVDVPLRVDAFGFCKSVTVKIFTYKTAFNFNLFKVLFAEITVICKEIKGRVFIFYIPIDVKILS